MIIEKKKSHLKVSVHEQKASKAHSISNIKNCYFPFQPYSEQIELIGLIHQTVSEKKMP